MTSAQQAHQDRIVKRFAAEFREKFTKGQAEHGGDMWRKPGMLQHAKEEVLDLVAYLFTLEEQLQPARDANLPPVVYLAGPFRAMNAWEVERNVRAAETVALEVWRRGYACLCPHTNTRHFDGAADDAIWLAGDLAMLARCDVVLMLPGWEASQGATAEHGYAISRGIPVLYDVAELRATDDRGTAGR